MAECGPEAGATAYVEDPLGGALVEEWIAEGPAEDLSQEESAEGLPVYLGQVAGERVGGGGIADVAAAIAQGERAG